MVLIGISSARREWRIGEARAMVIPVKPVLRARPHLRRHPLLRRPLAYRPGATSAHRQAWVKAQQADMKVRRAEVRVAALGNAQGHAQGKAPVLLGQLRLLPRRVVLGVTSRWVKLRARETAAIIEIRKNMDRPLDRIVNRLWRIALGRRCWRRLEPGLWDYELAVGRVIDRLQPDLIHVHDFRMLGVGARAKIRANAAGRPVKLVWDAHEYLPGLMPWSTRAGWLAAHCACELEYSRYADAVVTVSEPIADMLHIRHRLPRHGAAV